MKNKSRVHSKETGFRDLKEKKNILQKIKEKALNLENRVFERRETRVTLLKRRKAQIWSIRMIDHCDQESLSFTDDVLFVFWGGSAEVPHSYHHYYSNPSYHTLSQSRPPLPHLPNNHDRIIKVRARPSPSSACAPTPLAVKTQTLSDAQNTNNQLFCKNAARERRGLFGVETNATLPADWKHHEPRKDAGPSAAARRGSQMRASLITGSLTDVYEWIGRKNGSSFTLDIRLRTHTPCSSPHLALILHAPLPINLPKTWQESDKCVSDGLQERLASTGGTATVPAWGNITTKVVYRPLLTFEEQHPQCFCLSSTWYALCSLKNAFQSQILLFW